MHTITGGIKFEKGKEIPDKMKNWVKKNGMFSPFNANNFECDNKKDFVKLKNKK